MPELEGRVVDEQYGGKALRRFYSSLSDEQHKKPFPFEIAVHPNLSRRVIINLPGYNGEIDGFDEKYKKLGLHIQTEDLAAFVRTENRVVGKDIAAETKLRGTIQYVREHAWEICGDPAPEVMLMGASAGASAISTLGYEYPEVSTILLFAPSSNSPKSKIKQGMKEFRGDVIIVQGEQDDIVGVNAGRYFYDLAVNASNRKLFMIPDCDHQFTGEKNGRILSQVPFLAFSRGDGPSFLDPKGGIKLYD